MLAVFSLLVALVVLVVLVAIIIVLYLDPLARAGVSGFFWRLLNCTRTEIGGALAEARSTYEKNLMKQDDGLCHAYSDNPTVGWPGCTLNKNHTGNHKGDPT